MAGNGANEPVGDMLIKSGNDDDKNTAPKSKLFECWVGNSTMPAPGSLSDGFHGAMATCSNIVASNFMNIGNSCGVGTDHLIEEENTRKRSKVLLICSISIGFMHSVGHKGTNRWSVPSDPCSEVIETRPFTGHIYDQL